MAAIEQNCRQFLGIAVVAILATAEDQCFRFDAGCLGRIHIGKSPEQQSCCHRIDLLAFHELYRQPVRIASFGAFSGINCRKKEIPPPRPARQTLESHACQYSLAGPGACGHQFGGGSGAQRKTAEIKLRHLQMRDQCLDVPDQYVSGIGRRIVGCFAVTMGAQIGHDHSEPGTGKGLRMAKFDPVGMRIGKQAVQQDDRTPFPQFMDFESHAIE